MEENCAWLGFGVGDELLEHQSCVCDYGIEFANRRGSGKLNRQQRKDGGRGW